jgi:hypothetical protein
LRRQHAGNFESISDASNAGLISGKLIRAISRIAKIRRTADYSTPILNFAKAGSAVLWDA